MEEQYCMYLLSFIYELYVTKSDKDGHGISQSKEEGNRTVCNPLSHTGIRLCLSIHIFPSSVIVPLLPYPYHRSSLSSLFPRPSPSLPCTSSILALPFLTLLSPFPTLHFPRLPYPSLHSLPFFTVILK